MDNARDLNAVMTVFDLIKYSDNHSETSASLWQSYRDMLVETDNASIKDSESFKAKVKIRRKTPAAANTKNFKIAVPLKYQFLETF